MRVLFLDVDGVLNHDNADWSKGHLALDPVCIDRVRKVCKATGAKIVVSSTWRGSPEAMAVVLAELGEYIIGVTPFFHGRERRKEIEAWILQHSAIPLECVAVDDDTDCDGPAWAFVQTDAADGLTEAKLVEIVSAFGVLLPETLPCP